MKKEILISAVLLSLCSCVKNSYEPVEHKTKNKVEDPAEDVKEAVGVEEPNTNSIDIDGDLPDYVEMNGRIYRIRSMKSKNYKEIAEKDRNKATNSDFVAEKDGLVRFSHREITLIKSEKVPEKVENIARSKQPPISEFDRIAMQMVGKYVPDSFRHDRIYYGYMKFFEREWDRLAKSSLGHVSDWAAANIASRIPSTTDTLFYPCGGPDIAYALAFYPNASEYVLVGLEPIGRFKDLRKAMRDPGGFEQIKQSLSTYLRCGYFITSEMGKNLWDKWLRGTLYLILLQLSACDFEIANIEEIAIDANGNEILRRDSDGLIYCVKITCRKVGEQDWKKVYYVRADLATSNPKLKNLLNFMSKRRFNTMFKSASYAIWDRTLTKTRDFVLQNSQSILQDDTGVPFDYYRKGWKRYAFGTYTEPTLDIFKKVYKQPLMAEYFKNNAVAEIPFQIGYGFRQSKPNLLLAVSKAGEAKVLSRSMERSSSAASKKKEKKTAPIDRADVMAQVKELKDLKLSYDKDGNCKDCGDKKGFESRGEKDSQKSAENKLGTAESGVLTSDDNNLGEQKAGEAIFVHNPEELKKETSTASKNSKKEEEKSENKDSIKVEPESSGAAAKEASSSSSRFSKAVAELASKSNADIDAKLPTKSELPSTTTELSKSSSSDSSSNIAVSQKDGEQRGGAGITAGGDKVDSAESRESAKNETEKNTPNESSEIRFKINNTDTAGSQEKDSTNSEDDLEKRLEKVQI